MSTSLPRIGTTPQRPCHSAGVAAGFSTAESFRGNGCAHRTDTCWCYYSESRESLSAAARGPCPALVRRDPRFPSAVQSALVLPAQIRRVPGHLLPFVFVRAGLCLPAERSNQSPMRRLVPEMYVFSPPRPLVHWLAIWVPGIQRVNPLTATLSPSGGEGV
jgi:hypothetical protein